MDIHQSDQQNKHIYTFCVGILSGHANVSVMSGLHCVVVLTVDLETPLVLELGAVEGGVLGPAGQVAAVVRDLGNESEDRLRDAAVFYLEKAQDLNDAIA